VAAKAFASGVRAVVQAFAVLIVAAALIAIALLPGPAPASGRGQSEPTRTPEPTRALVATAAADVTLPAPPPGDGRGFHERRLPMVDPVEARSGALPPCSFRGGFAALERELRPWAAVGCVGDEHPDPALNGDMIQGTIDWNTGALGYMRWERATNALYWFDGRIVYTLTACGLQAREDAYRFRWELDQRLLRTEGPPPEVCALVPYRSADTAP
jgi:hypothetical protein